MATLFLNPAKQVYRVLTNLIMLFLLSFISINLSAQIDPTFCNGATSDWNGFKTGIYGYKLDKANATGNVDDQFTQGSKDEQQTSSWHWSNGSANAKGDITNAAVKLVNGCIL